MDTTMIVLIKAKTNESMYQLYHKLEDVSKEIELTITETNKEKHEMVVNLDAPSRRLLTSTVKMYPSLFNTEFYGPGPELLFITIKEKENGN